MWTILFWGAITVVVCGISFIVFLEIKYLLEDRKLRHRPIICVCEVNGRIGVVFRRDYDEASRRYWKPYCDGKEHYDAGASTAPDGRLLEVSPTFVFKARSREYYTLVEGCYVEQAAFYSPSVPESRLNPLAKAYQYFHGKPWDGDLINW